MPHLSEEYPSSDHVDGWHHQRHHHYDNHDVGINDRHPSPISTPTGKRSRPKQKFVGRNDIWRRTREWPSSPSSPNLSPSTFSPKDYKDDYDDESYDVDTRQYDDDTTMMTLGRPRRRQYHSPPNKRHRTTEMMSPNFLPSNGDIHKDPSPSVTSGQQNHNDHVSKQQKYSDHSCYLPKHRETTPFYGRRLANRNGRHGSNTKYKEDTDRNCNDDVIDMSMPPFKIANTLSDRTSTAMHGSTKNNRSVIGVHPPTRAAAATRSNTPLTKNGSGEKTNSVNSKGRITSALSEQEQLLLPSLQNRHPMLSYNTTTTNATTAMGGVGIPSPPTWNPLMFQYGLTANDLIIAAATIPPACSATNLLSSLSLPPASMNTWSSRDSRQRLLEELQAIKMNPALPIRGYPYAHSLLGHPTNSPTTIPATNVSGLLDRQQTAAARLVVQRPARLATMCSSNMATSEANVSTTALFPTTPSLDILTSLDLPKASDAKTLLVPTNVESGSATIS